MEMTSLLSLPPEILSNVAFHCCSETLSPPVALLQTCKHLHATLAPSENPDLYARVFRSAFDSAAAERRSAILEGPLVVRRRDEAANETAGDGSRRIKAAALAAELKRRSIALKRVARMVRQSDMSDLMAEDLWVIYLMLIENDQKNLTHLIGPDATVPLPELLSLYLDHDLIPASIAPGYPAETTERALAIWIAWLSSRYTSSLEDMNERDERQFVLRPYVFAAQQYATYFAPWTANNLPLSLGSSNGGASASAADARPFNPFVADLSPRNRKVQIGWYGQQLNLSPPILSLAAIQWFFLAGEGGEEPLDDIGGIDTSARNSEIAHIMNMMGGGGGGADSAGYLPRPTPDDKEDVLWDASLADPDHVNLLSSSSLHDQDFHRLLACYDPGRSIGMPRPTWRGNWNGCWEGTFSFFEFAAFRGMLAGQLRALYEGSYGEQAQVWKLKETYVRPIRERTPREARASKGKGKRKARAEGTAEEEDEEDDVRPPGLPLTGPMTNAGFPTEPLPSSSARTDWWGHAKASAEAAQLAETLRQQMEALPGYEVVPDEDVEDAFEEDEKDMEMLLTGTGHSAWGKFILKGRVRAWDGLATLVKEYTPDDRGKWIYRGYILAGNVLVGRWRDTFTPEDLVGYEGTFILNRR